MSAAEVRDRLADRFRLLQGSASGPGAPADAPPRGRLVLRPADRRRARPAAPHVGVRRRLRPGEHLRRRRRLRRGRRRRRPRAPRLAGPQVARRRRPHRQPGRGTACSRRSGSSPRIAWRRRAPSSETRDRHAAHFGREAAARLGALERARLARRRRLGGRRARQPAGRLPLERGARRPGRRDRHRRPRRADGLLGAALRDRSPGPRSCSTRRPRPTSAGSLASTRRPVCACFAGRAEAARIAGPPGHGAGGRPPLRLVRAGLRRRSSRRSARSTAATSTGTSSSPATVARRYGRARGYGLASYVDGLQASGRVDEAARPHGGVGGGGP